MKQIRLPFSPYSQSLVQTNASIVSGLNELLNWSITLPPTLKVDFEAIVEIGTLKTSQAMEANSGNQNLFAFQNVRISKFALLSTLGSSK